MATVPQTRTTVQHYAYYGEVYGVAELLNGSGYLFRAEGERQAVLVSYKDPALLFKPRQHILAASGHLSRPDFSG